MCGHVEIGTETVPPEPTGSTERHDVCLTKQEASSIIPFGIIELALMIVLEGVVQEVVMNRKALTVLAEINRSIIQFRGLYAAWAKEHGIRYHELLVLYTIRDQGFCTQRQICDSYLLPRQTINHVILDLRKRGLLELSPAHLSLIHI